MGGWGVGVFWISPISPDSDQMYSEEKRYRKVLHWMIYIHIYVFGRQLNVGGVSSAGTVLFHSAFSRWEGGAALALTSDSGIEGLCNNVFPALLARWWFDRRCSTKTRRYQKFSQKRHFLMRKLWAPVRSALLAPSSEALGEIAGLSVSTTLKTFKALITVYSSCYCECFWTCFLLALMQDPLWVWVIASLGSKLIYKRWNVIFEFCVGVIHRFKIFTLLCTVFVLFLFSSV